jgi:antitoxin MazE
LSNFSVSALSGDFLPKSSGIVELTKAGDTLVIRKKHSVATLDELLDSIPENFHYPDDVANFVASSVVGHEQ